MFRLRLLRLWLRRKRRVVGAHIEIAGVTVQASLSFLETVEHAERFFRVIAQTQVSAIDNYYLNTPVSFKDIAHRVLSKNRTELHLITKTNYEFAITI
jgi:hypothetical protein